MKINLESLPPVLHPIVSDIAANYAADLANGNVEGAQMVLGRLSDGTATELAIDRSGKEALDHSIMRAQAWARGNNADFAVTLVCGTEAVEETPDESDAARPAVLMVVETKQCTWVAVSPTRERPGESKRYDLDEIHFRRYQGLDYGEITSVLPAPPRSRMH